MIRIESPGSSYPLIFRSYGEALSFYNWLTWYFTVRHYATEGVKPGGYELKYRGSDLSGKVFTGDASLKLLPYYMQDL
jgi:hypothetical protein